MARKKLYGAAAAAHARKRARTSLAVRGPRSVTRYKTRTRTVRVRMPRRRRRGSSIGGGAAYRSLKAQLWDLGASAAYGFGTTSTGAGTATTIRDYVAKIPTISAIGKPASHGLIFHFAASVTGGMFRRVFGHLSHAALMRAAYNLGSADFDIQRTIKLSGDDDAIELSGELGDDDLGDDE